MNLCLAYIQILQVLVQALKVLGVFSIRKRTLAMLNGSFMVE